MISREIQINEIIADLENLKSQQFQNLYAVEENIKFFNAIRSRLGYLKWLIKDKPQIDPARLLELSDFGINKWQNILQKELLKLEKRKVPDILGPFKEALLDQILKITGKEPLVLLDLGSGAMEIERQLILKLQKMKFSKNVIFIGIDDSSASINQAHENLQDLNISIIQSGEPTNNFFDTLKNEKLKQFTVVLFKTKTSSLESYFKPKTVDLIFYSKFKHHVPIKEWAGLEKILFRISSKILEWDDYNGLYLLILSPFISWSYPVLLNGAVFSSLRDPTKKELKTTQLPWKVKIFPMTGYVKIYNEKNE